MVIDEYGQEHPLPKEAGEKIFYQKGYSRDYFFEGDAVLKLKISNSSYNEGKIKLKFEEPSKYILFETNMGYVTVPRQADDIQTLRFIHKSNNIFNRADSLQMLSRIFLNAISRIIEFSSMNGEAQLKIESKIYKDLAEIMKHDPNWSPYLNLFENFTKNKWLIIGWKSIQQDLRFLERTSTHHSFYEARFYSKNLSSCLQLIDSIRNDEKFNQLPHNYKQQLLITKKFLIDPLNAARSKDNSLNIWILKRAFEIFFNYKINGQILEDDESTVNQLTSIYRVSPQNGDFRVANIADGLAKFLPERSQYKIPNQYIKKIQLSFEESKDLQFLFPSVWQLINVSNDKYHFYHGFNIYREVISKDYDGFVHRFSDWINSRPSASKSNEYLVAFNHNYEILESIIGTRKKNSKVDSLTMHLDFINFLKKNLMDIDNQGNAISIQDFDNLNDVGEKYFLSLLYLQNPNLLESLTTIQQVYSEMASVNEKSEFDILENYFIFNTQMRLFLLVLKAYQNNSKKYVDYTIPENRYKAIYSYFENETNLALDGLKVFYDLSLRAKDISEVQSFSRRSFPFMVQSSQRRPFVNPSILEEIIIRTTAKDTSKIDLNKINRSTSVISNIYTHFALLNAAAFNQDMLTIVNSLTLPSSSAYRKFLSKESITINSYVGFKISKHSDLSYASFSTPIGLSYNITLGKQKRYLLAISAHFIDLTNPLSYKLSSSPETSNFGRWNWSSIYNPGGSISLRPRRFSPISFSIGVDYNISQEDKRELFYTLSIDTDIPLLFLFKKR